jgi:hypothetical protein
MDSLVVFLLLGFIGFAFAGIIGYLIARKGA